MTSRWFYLFALLFITQWTFAQGEKFNNLPLDTALVWLTERIVESPDSFHQRALQTLERSYQIDDDHLKAKAHLLLFQWHGYNMPFTTDSIFYHGEQALSLFEKVDDQENLALTCSRLIIYYVAENDLKRAEELAFRAIELYEDIADMKGVGKTYRRLGSIYELQKEPKLALKYALKALDIAEEYKDHYNTALAWLTLIEIYHKNDETEKAIQAAENCIATVKNRVPEEVYVLARAYAKKGTILADLGEYQKSIEDNTKAYAILEENLGADNPSSKTYRGGIGYAYYLQGSYKTALPHLNAAIDGQIAIEQDKSPSMQELYELQADCYFQLGNYQKAFESQQAAHLVFDTLMQDRIANLESEALFKYESGKKDQSIAEQAIIIKQNRRLQWLGIGLIGLLLLFLSTLFYYYQRNKKTSTALFVKNQENELLLKEIHHRVKNNLQTISSLLSLQSESISDQSALDAVLESKNRVASMALIHQKLYQGENLAAIEMRDYFETIGKAIKDSFGAQAKNVTLEVEMSEIELDVDTAIPVGLITNELVTNSFKHAFLNKKNGKISITLSQGKNGLLKLHIADNGYASEDGADLRKEKGFGTLLVQLLTTQLSGTLEKSNEAGTSTVIQFPQQEKSVA